MDLDPELALWILEFVLRRNVRLATCKRLLAMMPSESEYPPRVQRAIVQRLLVEGLTRRFINTVTLDNIEALHALRPLPSAADAYCIVAVHLAASATDFPSAVADLWDRRVVYNLRSPLMAGLASQRLISEGKNLCLAIAQPDLRTRILGRFSKNQALDAVRALLVADYEDVGPPILELVAKTIYRDEAENMASGSRAEATIPPVVAQQLQATPGAAQQQATRIMGLFTRNQVLDAVRALLEDGYEDVGPPILELVAETLDRGETENVPSGSRAEATIPPVVAQQLQATPRVAQQEMAQVTPGAAQQQATPSAAQQQATPSAAQQQATPSAAPQQATPSAAPQQATPSAAQQQATPSAAQQQATPSAAQQATPSAAQQQATPSAARQQATPVVAQQQVTPPRVAQREMAQITPGAAQQQATPRVAQQQTKDIPARVEQQQSTQMPSGAKATQMPPQGGESHMLPGGKEMPQQSDIDGGRLGKGTTTTMNEEGNSNKAMERGPAARTSERNGRLKGKAVCPPTLVENKRRKMRRWSVLEEDTLRNAVRELGKGFWKEILRNHSDVFEGRTEVDLKDKWRNMTR